MKKNRCIACRCVGTMLRVLGWAVLAGVGLFVVTFTVYMFNLENKLIYRYVYPFLQKHYNSQKRDRRI